MRDLPPINLNAATLSQLMLLSGIGHKRAAEIVAARPFRTPDELVSRNILTAGVYKRIADRLTVEVAMPQGD
jgi:DNA uptake protein ComE-like DNA-binding protein